MQGISYPSLTLYHHVNTFLVIETNIFFSMFSAVLFFCVSVSFLPSYQRYTEDTALSRQHQKSIYFEMNFCFQRYLALQIFQQNVKTILLPLDIVFVRQDLKIILFVLEICYFHQMAFSMLPKMTLLCKNCNTIWTMVVICFH